MSELKIARMALFYACEETKRYQRYHVASSSTLEARKFLEKDIFSALYIMS